MDIVPTIVNIIISIINKLLLQQTIMQRDECDQYLIPKISQ